MRYSRHIGSALLPHWESHNHERSEERGVNIVVSVLRQYARGKGAPPVAVLDRAINAMPDLFSAWVGQYRASAECAWPPLASELEPADNLLVYQHLGYAGRDFIIPKAL